MRNTIGAPRVSTTLSQSIFSWTVLNNFASRSVWGLRVTHGPKCRSVAWICSLKFIHESGIHSVFKEFFGLHTQGICVNNRPSDTNRSVLICCMVLTPFCQLVSIHPSLINLPHFGCSISNFGMSWIFLKTSLPALRQWRNQTCSFWYNTRVWQTDGQTNGHLFFCCSNTNASIACYTALVTKFVK